MFYLNLTTNKLVLQGQLHDYFTTINQPEKLSDEELERVTRIRNRTFVPRKNNVAFTRVTIITPDYDQNHYLATEEFQILNREIRPMIIVPKLIALPNKPVHSATDSNDEKRVSEFSISPVRL